MTQENRTVHNECYGCAFRERVAGSCHSSCTNFSQKVLDEGNVHGKRMGWFAYPHDFDPVWKGKTPCENYEPKLEGGSQ